MSLVEDVLLYIQVLQKDLFRTLLDEAQKGSQKWSLIFAGLPLYMQYALCPTKIAHKSSACVSSSWCLNQRLRLFPKRHVRKKPQPPSSVRKLLLLLYDELESAEHTPQCVMQRKRRMGNLSRFHGTKSVILKPVIRGSKMVGSSQNLASSFFDWGTSMFEVSLSIG